MWPAECRAQSAEAETLRRIRPLRADRADGKANGATLVTSISRNFAESPTACPG